MLAARRESGDGDASGSHHADGPHGKLEREEAAIVDAVGDGDVGAFGSERDFHFFLQAGEVLDRFASYQALRSDLDLHGNVVRGPGGDGIFRRFPNAMAAAELKLLLAGLAELVGEFFEQIWAADESVPHYARADVGGDDQLYRAIGDEVTVGPALPGD